MSETEARLAVLETRVKALEAFLEMTDNYSVIRGQGLIDQRKHKEQLKAEATKLRLEKESLPPSIRILKVTRRFDGTGIIARFEDLRQEGAQIITNAAISQEAADRLQEGKLSGFHLIQLSREPNTVFAMTSEVKDLPQKYEARINSDRSIEVELDEDAFQEF